MLYSKNMRTLNKSRLFGLMVVVLAGLPGYVQAQAFSDVTDKTFEKDAIISLVERGWITPQTPTLFGYGASITPADWFYLLMFLRTEDACPELGAVPNQYWSTESIRACLSGAGVPTVTERPDKVRRDEAMQQLFALRRRSFAFQQLQSKPVGFTNPADIREIPAKREGAMIAADRLKLIFRSQNRLLPAAPFLREDAVLAVSRFVEWERQGGADHETKQDQILTKEARLSHWRDLDTDMYVLEVKTGGDTYLRPILPRRSFNPAKDPAKEKLRDEFVYQPVSQLAKEQGAIAAVNGSYFNVEWPWGAFEDVVMLDGKAYLERTDRSTFIVCNDGKLYIGKYDKKRLQSVKCVPKHALGAGPLFIAEGEVLTQSTKEGFDEYTQWERRVGKNARTAIAISKDRKTAYIIVVAGKSYPAFGKGGSSLGTFLKEKYPDMSEAMMYDGGGSTTLYADESLLVGMGGRGNQAERAVVSALGVFSKKADQNFAKNWKKAQAKHWDTSSVTIKVDRPSTSFEWQTAKEAKNEGWDITLAGSRGSSIAWSDTKGRPKTAALTFDRVAEDAASHLIVTRREGTHEKGWVIPTELHVLNKADGSDVDLVKLFDYAPVAYRPDLKTLDVLLFRKTGVVLGDASGRVWFYYAKDQQISPAKFPAKTVSRSKK